ncbi:ATP-dependent DNA helicase pif1-like [Hydra vulgaris]|uniref:ATP-dependent DNA helicase n=1 Tax=Hydra vulgaris TaxID=6087 RepID=A0ABM4CB78_HYDVU
MDAGSRKTFTYNYLITETISRGYKSATAAWTGIAATLLTIGSTLHGLFKLPVPILDNSTCNVTPNSIHGHFLRQVSLFLLDETSMIPKHALNAIDRLLKDICNNNFPFCGKIFFFCGDFRQILPVVKRGQPAEIVKSRIKCSLHWQWVQKFALTENMRVHDGECKMEGEFSQWLLKLGNGTIPVKEEDPFKGCIEIPNQCIIRENESIVEKIFGDADQNHYSKRVILTPTNVDSLSINEEVLECLPGMPPHCLKLKIGCLIMLLRNLDLKAGLCNGILKLKFVLFKIIIVDAELAPSDSNIPFVLKFRRFPVRLAYSMTINKSQGQTFDRVGVYLMVNYMLHVQELIVFNSSFFKIDKHLIQGMIKGVNILLLCVIVVMFCVDRLLGFTIITFSINVYINLNYINENFHDSSIIGESYYQSENLLSIVCLFFCLVENNEERGIDQERSNKGVK